jgi:hypothetical protein
MDASGNKLLLRAASGVSDAYLNRGPIDTEEPIFKALKGEPIFIADAAEDPRIKYPGSSRGSGLSILADSSRHDPSGSICFPPRSTDYLKSPRIFSCPRSRNPPAACEIRISPVDTCASFQWHRRIAVLSP